MEDLVNLYASKVMVSSKLIPNALLYDIFFKCKRI